MVDDIKNKIEEISNEIKKYNEKNYSLLEGRSGVLLFLYKYSQYTKLQNNIDFFEEQLQNFILKFQEVETSTFCNGFFGNVWLLDYFKQEQVLDGLLDDIEDELNQLYMESGSLFLKSKSYDFLHGLLGLIYVGIYCNHIDKASVNKLLGEMLKDLKTEDDDTAYYTDWMYKEKTTAKDGQINFALSHGLSSVASIFAMSDKESGNSVYAKKILNFIYKYKTFKEGKNHYSARVVSNREFEDDSTRLAWCYGDVGIACAFYNVGKKLNIEGFKEEGINIMKNLSSRRDLNEGAIVDAGLCHGTAGMAHIFNRFYKETHMPEFDTARWFWVGETLKMAKVNTGLAGYQTYRGNNVWKNDYAVLEGISGIGLSLMGFLSDDIEDLNWDQCLLIS